jgi:hypothetical protein
LADAYGDEIATMLRAATTRTFSGIQLDGADPPF